MDASQWTVFNRTYIATGYMTDKASQSTDGGVEFSFPTVHLSSPPEAGDGPFTSLLMAHISGDLTGMTIEAKVKVTASSDAVFTFNPNANTGPTPPTVRLTFWTTVGPFNNENYWWSNDVGFQELTAGVFTLTASVSADHWSSLDGKMGTVVPNDFAFAAANAKLIGVSFGGGSFFLNGVGVSAGTATFELTSLAVS